MKIHHIALRTRDLTRLTAFYVCVVGLAPVGERPGEAVWLSLGESVLMLELAAQDEPAVPPQSMDLLAFAVDEPGRAALRARLEAMDLRTEGETRWTTYFRDPDGRRVAVSTYSFEP